MRTRLLSAIAGTWCSLYTVVHVWWAVAGDPGFFVGGSPDDCQEMCGESPLPGGWLPVVLGAVLPGVKHMERRERAVAEATLEQHLGALRPLRQTQRSHVVGELGGRSTCPARP